MTRRGQDGKSGTDRHLAKRGKAASISPRMAESSTQAETTPEMLRLIVALGASAGGLDAFKAFFTAMPPQSGMAFVLVQHLDPDHKSLLVELLSKHTAMPVVQAEDGMAVTADHVFVIPPNAVMTIKGGVLSVTTPALPRAQRKPIDVFFASLAEDREERAVCVILSGSGSDGSLGLRVVKERGGFTMAQAGFDETALLGMPSSAAATGLVDEVVPVERMPERLLAYEQHLSGIGDRKAPDGTRLDAAEHLTKICALLRARLGHDFSAYKENTVIRRVQRRMQVLQIDNVPAYIERLRQDPIQLDLLFRDLLIGVTEFFRDPPAFEALETEVLPRLLKNKRSDDQFRVWVPGCATGEEAYSIAILVKEAMIKLEAAPKVQIFATDLDDRAVTIARHGRYRKPLSGVSIERLERWFVEEGDDYRVTKEIREMCVYSTHNLIKDPPFSKLDLISCRNLLIYLNVPLQNRMMRIFHYALQPSRYLFLGASEGVSRHGDLFAVGDKKHRIFQRRDEVAASLPTDTLRSAPAQVDSVVAQPKKTIGDGIEQRVRHALETYFPAYVVINRQHEVLHFSYRTGQYIEHSPGAASLNLFGILRKDLLPTVRTAVQKAFATREPVHDDVVIALNGNSKTVNLVIAPIANEADAELYVVAFQDRGVAAGRSAAAATGASVDSRLQALEKELDSARTQLQHTIDDLETANEELKSSNEEYQSVNEEFQSTNEELESSKEELQSINEELNTINSELAAKNEALAEANSDIKNLLDSTQIAMLFLDKDLRIRNFTPAMSEIFHVRAGDRGRPITDIVTRLSYPNLKRDVKKVLDSLSMIEHEVTIAPDGASFLMRILPYRTVDDVIAGVVITFTDITERKRQEEERGRLAAIVDSSQDAIIGHSLQGTVTSWNAGAEEIFGYKANEVIGKPLSVLVPEHQFDEAPQILEKLARGERVDDFAIRRVTKSGKSIDISMTISPVRNESGVMIGASTVGRDVSERKHADDLRALMINELNHRVKNTLATVQSIAAQSLKEESGVESRKSFDARIVALSRTHDLLARESWESASLRDVLLQELEPYQSNEGARFVIEGPDFELQPKAALALGMAFHELATNAVKYGALSKPTGQVRVTWDFLRSSESTTLRLRWAETGGPPVQKTAHRGFGTTVIERGLSLELDGEVRLELDPGGVICTVEIPLSDAGNTGNQERGSG